MTEGNAQKRANAFAITGTAGAGKTTAILGVIEEALQEHDSDEVYLVGLTHATKKAALARGLHLPDGHVTTMDSLAFRLFYQAYGYYPKLFHPNAGSTGVNKFKYKKESRELIEKFSNECNWRMYHDLNVPEGTRVSDEATSKIWRLYGLTRQKLLEPETVERYISGSNIDYTTYTQFQREYEEWAKYNEVYDFTAVKELLLANEVMLPNLTHIAFLDEAQDNNALELAIWHQWGTGLYEYWLAGDPNQAIYENMRGAVGPAFLELVPDANEWKLPKSNRCSSEILSYGFTLTRRASTFHDYGEVEPRAIGGTVEEVDLTLDGPAEVARWLAGYVESSTKVIAVLASFDGGREHLSSVAVELDRIGVMYYNPYSEDYKWQQFDSRTLNKIKAFLKRPWSVANVLDWSGLVGTSLVFNHGILGKLEGDATKHKSPLYPLGQEVTPEIAGVIFKSGAEVLEADLPWVTSHQIKSSVGKAAVIAAQNVITRYGTTEALDAEPSIIIGTIHSVKGGEADSVLVFPDISYARLAEGGEVNDDEVHRLMYVAVTRARTAVYLGRPMGQSLRNNLFYSW